jgi:hypothetical protein
MAHDISGSDRYRPAPRTLLIAVLLLAASALALVLRLQQSHASMVFDEYASMFFSRRSWGELWGWWMLRETNPPLFYSLLKAWRAVTPQSQAALRLLPLLISLAQMALLARLAGRTYGAFAAVLCVLLLAVSPSDIYQSEYLRAYGLAKLAVTVSFVGLLHALEGSPTAPRGWIAYVAGAIVAIYSHTTMLLWPPVATLAVLVEAAMARRITARQIGTLLAMGAAILALSGWVVAIALLQLRAHAGDISWIEPLSLEDYASSIDLQLLQDAPIGSSLMGLLMLVGVARTWRRPATRMALVIVVATLAAYKLADRIHPITSDYTLHWCAAFTVLLAAAALSDWRQDCQPRPRLEAAIATGVALLVAGTGSYDLKNDVWIPRPQDFHAALQTVAHTPGAALLASHESDGVVIQQACMIEFGSATCPFPLVVLANPARSDSWATGGLRGPLTAPNDTYAALGATKTVYAFSRYVYTPLVQLGMDEHHYRRTEWDDGELIGPIPIADFAARSASKPSRLAIRRARD